MKQTTKRILSALLVLCMVLSILPTGVFAAPDDNTVQVKLIHRVQGASVTLGDAFESITATLKGDDTNWYYEVPLPEGYDTVLRSAAVNANQPSSNGLYADNGNGTSTCAGYQVSYDFEAKVAKLTPKTTQKLDSSKVYKMYLYCSERQFVIKYSDTFVHSGLKWSSTITMRDVPAVDGKVALGWQHGDVLYLAGSEVAISDLFANEAYETTELDFEAVYADLPDAAAQHIVLWTDSLTGEIYRVDTVADGAELPEAPEVSKIGYDFVAWDRVNPEEPTLVADNMVIHANWEAKTVTVEGIAQNGTFDAVNSAKVGQNYMFELTADEGYIPQGVVVTADDATLPVLATLNALYGQTATYSVTIPATDSSTIMLRGYTEKQAVSYTLDFYADNDLAETLTVDENGAFTVPAVPEKPGYTAKGWQKDDLTLTPGDELDVIADYEGRWNAVYEAKDYVLNWYQSEQALPEKTTVKYGDFYIVPEYTGEVPDGQYFLGWRCKEFGQFVTEHQATEMRFTPGSGELEFYPVFAENTKYWVASFVDTEGHLIDAELVEQSTTATVTMPVYEKYPAAKWTREGSEDLYAANETVSIETDTTFTVDLSNYVKITLISNPFTGEVLSEGLYEIGSEFTFPMVTSFAPGYQQGTNSTWSGGGYNYNTGRTINVPAVDTRYTYQGVDCKVYTVFYYNEAGNSYTTRDARYSYLFTVEGYPTGANFSIPEGKTFLGWNDQNGRVYLAGKEYKYTDTDNLHLKPIFSDNTEYYLVQFVSEGVVCDAQLIPVDGETHTAAKPADPTRTGYGFIGWFNGDTPYSEDAEITGDTVYTARWTAARYNVKYIAYGEGVLIPTTTVTYGSTFTVEAYPGVLEANQTFIGWLGSNGKFYDAGRTYAVDFAEDIVMTPMFDTDTTYWLVNWVVDGAIVRSSLYEQKAGQDPIDSMPADPEKPGYTFVGWQGYTDGMELTGSTTFTAVFEADTYHVTLVSSDHVTLDMMPENGEAQLGDRVLIGAHADSGYETYYLYALTASGKPVALTQFSGEAYDTPDTDGYTFVMPAEDVTVTVVEKANRNTVQFIVDGELYAQDYVLTGEVPAAPATPVKEGYTFLGWRAASTDVLYGANAEFDAIKADETYTAEFEANTYKVTTVSSEHVTLNVLPANGEAKMGDRVLIGAYAENGYETFLLYAQTASGKPVALSQFSGAPYDAPDANGYTFIMPAEDVTVSVLEKANRNTVQFVVENEIYAFEYVLSGEVPAAPVTPVKEGYTFTGWRAASTDKLYPEGTEFDAVYADETYTAEFERNTYHVTLISSEHVTLNILPQDGNAGAGDKVLIGAYAESGYETFFLYAYTLSGKPVALSQFGGEPYDVPDANGYTFLMPAEDVIVTVVEKANRNTVQFVVDDEVYAFEYVLSGSAPAAPATPVKEGYTFIGWRAASTDKLYEAGTEFDAIYADETYTAEFEINTYHVTLISSDHVTLGILPEDGDAHMGDKVVIGAYAEAGYETFFLYARTASGTPIALSQFGGEPYDVPDANGYVFVMPAEDVIVTVVEKANRNTVQFIVDDEVYAFEYVLSGKVPTAPVEPVKEGYTFTGWRAASTGKFYEAGTEFDAIYADETYTAEFEINTYDLTYYRGAEADESEFKCILELPDGTFVEFFNNDTANMPTYVIHDVAYGDTVVLAEPMLPGYVFKGWGDERGYMHPAGAKFTMPADDVLLTAVWEIDESLSCLVRFVNNGQIYDAFLAFDGQNASIPATDPVLAGKTFKGWQYGENVYSNDGVKDFVVVASEDREMTFEAVWDDNLYSVTYNVDGVLTTEENIPYGATRVTLDAPEKEGFTFIAWEDAETGAYYLEKAAFTVTADRTFTAIWAEDEIEYTVKFYDEKGNLIDLFVEPAGTVINAPAYGQGRDDAEYLWVDTLNGKFLREDQELLVDQNYSFLATMISEEDYVVNVTVLPADAPENVASVVGTTHKRDELVRVNVTIPEGYILKGISAVTSTEAPVVSSLVHEYDDRYTLILTMPSDDVDVTVELEKIPVGSVVLKFFDEKGNLVDQLVVEEGTEITTPAYEQGRPDATYQWVDEENNTFVAPEALFTANQNYTFRAVLIDEAEYTVNVTVTPDDAPANVAEALKHEYKLGETAEVAINVPDGYLLKAVSALTQNGEPVNASLIHNDDGTYTYYLTMPADNVNVTVELWKIPAGKTAVKFMVDGELFDLVFVTKGENGTAPETEPTKPGYTFKHWSKDTTVVEAGQPFAVAADEENVIVFNAVFDQASYVVDFDADGGIPQPGAVTAVYGESIELPAAPMKTGSKFVGWREASTGFVYGATGTYVVKSDAHFTAIWATNQYIVRFIDRETNQTFGYELVSAGETVTAPAGPITSGKTFVNWENEDGSKTVEAGKTTEPIFADTTYYATYTVNTHNIAVVTDNCSVTGIPTGTVAVGEEIVFSVKANDRYAMSSVVLSYTDGLSPVIRELYPDNDGLYSFTMPDADVTVTATAVQNVFSIFTQTDGNCTVTLLTGPYATAGDSVAFELTFKEGYVLNSLYVTANDGMTYIPTSLVFNGSDTEGLGYVLTMPAADIMIFASAKKADLTVTYLDEDNTVLAIEPVAYGELADAPVAEKEGYKFVGWEILPQNGKMFDPETDAVTENLIVRAVYEGLPFTVEAGLVDHVHTLNAECTVSSGNLNSSNLLLNALTAEAGKDVYFTVAADYDYVITGVAIVGADGSKTIIEPTLRLKETVDGINYYTVTFPMPAENVKIDVYTAAKLFRVDVTENLEYAGDYTINGYRTTNLLVPQGEQVTIDIQPIPGYEVVDVTGTFFDGTSRVSLVDFELNADKTKFTFPMVARDVQVEITYEAIDYTIDVQTSNFETYKPDASVNPAKVVESLDPELTSKGRIELLPLKMVDYTNANEQVYKIPANGTANVDNRICFRVVEYTGYELSLLTVTYDNGERTCPLTLKDGLWYFDMPADDVVITAVFTEKTYQVKKDSLAEIHGTVEMNGLRENIISVDYKNEVNVTVTPDDGYQVSKIYYVLADGTVKDFDAASYESTATMTDALDHEHSITFHMPATTVTVCVEYTAIEYTIDDVCDEATASYTTPHTVGEQVSFTTEANEGYLITKVYVVNKFTGERVEVHTASTNAVYGATYTFTMPAAPVTIHVETVEDEFNVVYLANGSVVDYEDVPYLHTADVASRVAMVENAPAGYHFVGWTSKEVQTPVTVPSVNNDDFVVVKKTYIVAAYEKDEIDVHFLATENGTVTETSTGNTAEYVLTTTVFGDTVNFTAVPDEGYVIDEVKVTTTNTDGYNLDIRYTVTGDAYSFVIPATYKANVRDTKAEDVIVSVTFKKAAFTLTKAADCGTDGTIAVNGKVTTQTTFHYDFQDEVNITATPNDGYYVASIIAVCDDGSHKYEVTGTKPATDGTAAPLTLSFAMPACDLTFKVVYEKIDYSITCVFDAEQGKVTTAPADKAQLGDIVTVTVTPEPGYELADLTVTYANGEKSCVLTQTAENTFTFTMPADAVVVTAVFDEITYTADLTVEGEADVTLNGFYTYNIDAKYLDTVTIDVTPAAGWELISITVDGGAIKVNEEIQKTGGKYTFTMPEHDVKIEVKVEKTGYALDSHALNFYEIGHGKVSLTPEKVAYVGDLVVISADPDDGYRVKEVVVQDEQGNAVPVSFLNGTPGYVETWAFTMPAAAVTVTVYFEVQGASYFDDVRTDHWFYDAVTFVTDRGYFRGVEETIFAPYMNMNRAMFVTVIGRIYGVDVTKYTGKSFNDVEDNSWYAPYVAWASENSIVLGRDANTFDPYADISREEMAAIMYRFCKYLGCDMTIKNEVFMDRYEDAKNISPWAEQYVRWAVGVGLMRGRTKTTIDPLDLASRAEVAQVIKNLCDKVLYQ